MAENFSTFSSLAKDFNIPVSEVRNLARQCGIPTRPRERYLSQDEINMLYDVWLSSKVDNSYKETDTYSDEMPEKNDNARDNWSIDKEMILIDTSSLLRDGAEKFLKIAVPELLRTNQKIIVPFVVMNELNRHVLQTDNPELSRRARDMTNLILNYRDMGAIAIYGDDNDGTFADNVFHKVVTMFSRRYNLIVITQDYLLGQDLMTMGHLPSVRRKKISVCKIEKNGDLTEFSWDKGGI